MAGLLEGDYGAAEERRARVIKIIVVSVLALTVIAGTVYFFFHNYRQEWQVKQFMKLLEARDYQGAYNVWTGSDSDRARYPMSDFMRDWGPPVDVSRYAILDSESCDKSVIVDVDAGHAGDRKVWVGRASLSMSFPPNEAGCVQTLVDGRGNLLYRYKHNKIYEWFRNLRYRLRGRTYQR
jgi:hypothetical protein